LANASTQTTDIYLQADPTDVERRVARYGDFSKMNNRWYASSSDKTHERLASTPEEWAHYHTMYRQLRETWPVVHDADPATCGSRRWGPVDQLDESSGSFWHTGGTRGARARPVRGITP
jgi:hypothetical protein